MSTATSGARGVALARATLGALPRGVAAPAYDPAKLRPGIVHIGVGNFHRAHQAVYLDDVFARGFGTDFAIVGAGIRDTDRAMRAALERQDWLSTVIAQDAGGAQARVTAAMTGFVDPGAPAALVDALANPQIRIASLTITEGGYCVDATTGAFDPEHPAIVADAEALRDSGSGTAMPHTAFAPLVAALARRRAAGTGAFTVMSCDNLPGNGAAARAAVVGLATRVDPALGAWIDAQAAFPNSMVDRITPATTARERALVVERFGIADAQPVFCESFREWVLEDRFAAGRPPLEEAGVTFVDDVHAHELMKIRILNGGHAAIAYPAGLLDIHFVHEAMAHPLIRGFLEKLEREEIIPIVPPVPDTSLTDYYELIERRFSNPKIGDTVTRLCLDGSNRQPKFILPSAADRLKAGQSVTGLALVSAFWCRYCYGETDSGKVIPPNDPSWNRLNQEARRARADPKAWLGMTDIFGDLAREPAYVTAFSHALDTIWSIGTKATLEAYLNDRL